MKRALALLLLAFSASAELSPNLKDWSAGPVQWLMTADEKRDWHKVATDDAAVQFIDLFWARRDPTPATPGNEFRHEFDLRVNYTDQNFAEKRKRGALSDRGRVYILLGPPSDMGGAVRTTNSQLGMSDEASGSRQRGARIIWLWEKENARKFDMPKVEVLFVEDQVAGSYQRDPKRPDFGLAGPTAIRKAIVSPDLTQAPVWPESTVYVPPSASELPPETPEPAGPAMASSTPGASRLTLVAGSIDARSATDPFANQTASAFKSKDNVQWAVQHCAAKAEVPKLKFMLLITGPLDGASTEQRTKEKDAKPQGMASSPGCYVVQGQVPVAKLSAGRYKLSVFIDDAVTGDTYTLKREFRLE